MIHRAAGRYPCPAKLLMKRHRARSLMKHQTEKMLETREIQCTVKRLVIHQTKIPRLPAVDSRAVKNANRQDVCHIRLPHFSILGMQDRSGSGCRDWLTDAQAYEAQVVMNHFSHACFYFFFRCYSGIVLQAEESRRYAACAAL